MEENPALLVPLCLDETLAAYYQYALAKELPDSDNLDNSMLLGMSSSLYFFACEICATDEFGQPCPVWYLLVGTKAGTLRYAYLINMQKIQEIFGQNADIGEVLNAIISSAHVLLDEGLHEHYNFLGSN